MGAAFYDEEVCRHSRRGEYSPYKCRCYECKHHYKHVPQMVEIEFYEFNPFSKSAKIKCPYYQTKAQMTVQNNRRLHDGKAIRN